ncbi:MAG: hypothetical protein ACPLQS_05445 [Desulfurococcaceae archaeon]
MISLIITINVIGFMLLYVLLFRLIKRTRYYRKLEEIYEQASKVPGKVSTKGDVRRLKKYKPYVKALKRKMSTLIFLNIAIFLAVYASMLFSTILIVNKYSVLLVESPVAIPFFSYYSLEDRKMYIYVYTIVLLAFAMTTYPVTREMRIKKS